MRVLLALVLLAAGGCGDSGDTELTPLPDATVPGPDAASSAVDASGVEDLEMTLADFADIQGFMTPAGRNYKVANPLGHIAEALAAASSPTGGTFPVGSIVEVQKAEAMVKRRTGWNPASRDWEFFRIKFSSDGKTPVSFEVRGAQETACFSCHAMLSSATWDLICDHP